MFDCFFSMGSGVRLLSLHTLLRRLSPETLAAVTIDTAFDNRGPLLDISIVDDLFSKLCRFLSRVGVVLLSCFLLPPMFDLQLLSCSDSTFISEKRCRHELNWDEKLS